MPLTRCVRAYRLVPVLALFAAGLASSGCESDDTSPLTPVTDASTDHTTTGSDAASDGHPQMGTDGSTDAGAEGSSSAEAGHDSATGDANQGD